MSRRALPTRILVGLSVVCLAWVAACRDQPVATGPVDEKPDTHVVPIGVVEVTISGLGTASASARSLSFSLNGPRNVDLSGDGSIQLEPVTSGSFTEGTRGVDGVRYIYATFRVRNATAAKTAYNTARTNLTFLAIQTASTLGGGPISSVRRFDGTAASVALADMAVPTGAVGLNDSLQMNALYPDVLQVLTEAEAGAVTRPTGVTDVLPYGFVVRNPNASSNRTLPANPGPNQFDGLVTFAFRVPQQATVQQDAYTISMQFLAVDDTETRLTESIEEQDTASVRRLRARATALGATTVTVLNGSSVMAPAVPDYPGQRQICSARTAGAAGSPTHTMVDPGAYTIIQLYTVGESVSSCGAYFHGGTASRPATNVPFSFTARAMDRYGNVMTAAVDTFTVSSTGPGTVPGPQAVVSGAATFPVTFSAYGTPEVYALGRRNGGSIGMVVAGVTRTWTGTVSTDYSANGNWNIGAAPMPLDSIVIPTGTPFSPNLFSNQQIGGITVADGAVLALNAFDMTASANVAAGLSSGGIVNTSGRLFLSGVARTVQGRLPTVRVQPSATYSMTVGSETNLNARAPFQVDAGRMTVSGLRLQVDSN
jgi:hypothetical protein